MNQTQRSKKTTLKVCLATGGTGGHIYPALALARIWKESEPVDLFFIGNDDRMEARLIPQEGYAFFALHTKGLSHSLIESGKAISLMFKAYHQAIDILKAQQADLVIGFGSYVSAPVFMAARHLHIPYMIHEQNSLPGKTNRLFAKQAKAIITCYEKNKEFFQEEKIHLLGNPRASLVVKEPGDLNYFKSLGLDPEKETIMIMMGSLGSSSVNEIMLEALKDIDSFQILYICGKDNESFQDQINQENVFAIPFADTAKIFPFLKGIIARAGATTLAEITALGLPSILIPSPYVANDHQTFNAKEMVDQGASFMIKEEDLNAHTLKEAIDKVFVDESARDQMAQRARKSGRPQAAFDMIALAHSLVEKGNE